MPLTPSNHKASFSDLTEEQRSHFGDGCSYVPDFIFTADCRHHDFNYSRGGYLIDKIDADWNMCRLMWADSSLWWHYVVTLLYWLGLTFLPFSYFSFTYGDWLSLEEILKAQV